MNSRTQLGYVCWGMDKLGTTGPLGLKGGTGMVLNKVYNPHNFFFLLLVSFSRF